MLAPRNRIELLDVARGFAILGILGLNIFIFAMPFEAMVIPAIWGDANTANAITWEISVIGFSGVMRGMISVLFGAAAYMMLKRAENEPGFSGLDRFFRRLLALILFGVIHAYVLLWPHDILYVYGVVGLLLFPFRNVPVKVLAVMVAVMLTASAIFTAENTNEIAEAREQVQDTLTDEERRQLRESDPLLEELQDGSFLFSPLPQEPVRVASLSGGNAASDAQEEEMNAAEMEAIEQIAQTISEEIEARQQGYVANFLALAPLSLTQQTTEMLTNHLLDVGTFFLLGVILFRIGFLTGALEASVYWRVLGVGLVIGLFIGVLSRMDFDETDALYGLSNFFNDYGYDYRRFALALANFAALALLVKGKVLTGLTSRLADCGRMALTLYVSQTIVCNTIFLGVGFGLFGQLEHYQIGLLFVALTLLQLFIAPIYLRHFNQGPLEYLLRQIVDWRTPKPTGLTA